MKQLFRFSILLLALLLPALATAHDFEVDGIYYKINGNKVEVTYQGEFPGFFNGYSGSVVIPATVTYNGTTYPVTSIFCNAFNGCEGLTNIIIPNSVTEIDDFAFEDCTGLTSIVIPNSVTDIWESAFQGCTGLTSIVIPNSVTSIGEKAFKGCSGLTSVAIPGTVTSIGDGAFNNCSGLTDVYCYIANPLSVSVAYDAFDLDDWDVVSDRTLHVLPGTTEAYYEVGWYWFFYQVIEDLIPEPEPQPGDVNGDREVNIADVNAVIDIILSGNSSATAADVNGDGEINIADINAVIDIILDN